MTKLEESTPSHEILVVCNQLQAIYDPRKIEWTINELYKKIFDEPHLKENRLSIDSFEKDMDWILKKGLISYKGDQLYIDETTKLNLINFFNIHRRVIEGL